jgi:hypothetical protein
MATALYGKGRQAFGNGVIDWVNDDIRAILNDNTDYVVSIDADDFLADIAGAARVGVSAATIAGKANSLGVMDATDHVIASVSGDAFDAIVLYQHTGDEATAALIAFIDNYTGLPCTPNGGNITISWPNDSNKIFKL